MEILQNKQRDIIAIMKTIYAQLLICHSDLWSTTASLDGWMMVAQFVANIPATKTIPSINSIARSIVSI